MNKIIKILIYLVWLEVKYGEVYINLLNNIELLDLKGGRVR